MRFAWFMVLASVLVAASACRPAAAPVTVSNRPVSINDRPVSNAPEGPKRPVAEMTWTTGEGSVSKLKDFQGKAVILDFWATYCPPCIEEIPHLMSLKSKYGDRVELVGLHVGGEEDRPKVPAFVQKLKITYPIAYPEDQLTDYVTEGDSRIPQTAVFDREGNLVDKFIGFDANVKADLDGAVERAVSR